MTPRKVISRTGAVRWEDNIELPRDAQGNRRKAHLSARTREELRDKIATRLKEEAHGPKPKRTALTFGAWLGQWLAGKRIRVSTRGSYSQIIKKLPADLTSTPVQHLTAPQMRSYYERLRATHSDGSLRNVHSILRSALEAAVNDGLLQHNPLLRVEHPKRSRRHADVESGETVLEHLEKSKGTDVELLVHLAAYTGLSRSEILGLTWGHIDLESKQLKVVQGRHLPARGGVTSPKTESRVRVLALSDVLIPLLQAHKQHPAAFVVPLTYGTSCYRTRKLGIKLHVKRHFHATQLLHAGVSLDRVSKRLGHSNVATTADYYIDAIPAIDQESAEVIEKVLGTIWEQRSDFKG